MEGEGERFEWDWGFFSYVRAGGWEGKGRS